MVVATRTREQVQDTELEAEKEAMDPGAHISDSVGQPQRADRQKPKQPRVPPTDWGKRLTPTRQTAPPYQLHLIDLKPIFAGNELK